MRSDQFYTQQWKCDSVTNQQHHEVVRPESFVIRLLCLWNSAFWPCRSSNIRSCSYCRVFAKCDIGSKGRGAKPSSQNFGSIPKVMLRKMLWRSHVHRKHCDQIHRAFCCSSLRAYLLSRAGYVYGFKRAKNKAYDCYNVYCFGPGSLKICMN